MEPPLRIVFAGTPEFAVPSLRALVEGPDSLVGVLTQPDRTAGRGRHLQPPPVKTVAEKARVPVAQPETLKGGVGQRVLSGWAPDLMVVAAYGLLLPAEVLELPRLGCLNVHASLLPAYRGAAPIQRAILDGRRATGITIMQMTPGMDRGPILLQRARAIGERETAGELNDALARLGAEVLAETVAGLRAGNLEGRAQDPNQATYAPKITKEEAELDWTQSAADLANRVRGFNPWPVAFVRLGGGPLRIWQARTGGPTEQAPATLVRDETGEPAVACGDGSLLVLEEVQPPGRRRMSATEAVRGGHLDPGSLLSDRVTAHGSTD
ncbi:methionyl-tRNA formyltransferase [Thiohalorhabdus sp.]|uniref:methionyl-tRNA formyltransferase n=1 Tax=Thiohalorhabdus sp. TaxID=3094134 RepID=UPI002FC2F681